MAADARPPTRSAASKKNSSTPASCFGHVQVQRGRVHERCAVDVLLQLVQRTGRGRVDREPGGRGVTGRAGLPDQLGGAEDPMSPAGILGPLQHNLRAAVAELERTTLHAAREASYELVRRAVGTVDVGNNLGRALLHLRASR